MTIIIAGRFQQQSSASEAVEELQRAGFSPEHISSFYVNPPGQHDTYPIGGDHAISRGAKKSDKGVVMGALTGGAVGAATVPFLGPIGPITGGLLGAHIGGLMGSLSQMKEQGESEEENDTENAQPLRHSGMLVAVSVFNDNQQKQAAALLDSLGATEIERADGRIENGDWSDFDPAASPHFLKTGEAPLL